MTARRRTLPRQRQPELEHDRGRSPELGYEPPDTSGSIRCLAHGFPTPLARWHYHDEYELHLIVASSGKTFVGDYIGYFQPGHLVLTGPRLPHNWISLDLPEGGIAERDLVIQFAHAPIAQAAAHLPELAELLPLLDRARNGVEFFGLSERAVDHWHKVKARQGLARLGAFCEFLADLARCTDYRLLSHAQLQSEDNAAQLDQINAILSRITADLGQPLSAAQLAAELGMSESRFSRFFRRATGNTFTDFVNQVRINRACQLLMESDQYITHICYEVGFNNVANFNRRFLDFKGMTPGEFRRQVDGRFGIKR
ncbi:AraC family transcriptional regulator [Polaromonas sp. C04]|uniref:AraC family transcriptional regulator n=1 Tax=Polaromonas sp. C04 TaxID=1945857 RepID=UPI0009857BB4|nr:AraC family transcriptional regulator [Polaromonas sp. C04]OOG58810.1 AraC family transcriptional regulator [Polaromonas sp. C04]